MKKTSALLTIIYLVFSCTPEVKEYDNTFSEKDTALTQKTISSFEQKDMIGKAYIGMTIEELKQAYQTAKFKEEPLYMYGVDSENNGLLIVENEEPLLFVWTLEDNNKVHGISVLSPQIKIDSDVQVGMTMGKFKEKYPNATLAINMIDDSYEYSYVKGINYMIEFTTTDSTRVGTYDFSSAEPEFISIKRPEAKVDRISIH
jgi:hypothetical protein